MNYLSEIEKLRAKIKDRHGAWSALANQYTSRARAVRLVDERIEAHAAKGAASLKFAVDKLAAGQPAALFTVTAAVNTDHGAYPVTIDLGPMLCALLGPLILRKALESALQDVPEGLTPAVRNERMNALVEELEKLESKEESLIRGAELTGLTIARRPDADPACVLALEVGK